MAKSVVPPTFFRRSISDHCQLFRDHAQLHPGFRQTSMPNDLTQTSQASKLKVSKIASQQAEASQLGLLAYYQLYAVATSCSLIRPRIIVSALYPICGTFHNPVAKKALLGRNHSDRTASTKIKPRAHTYSASSPITIIDRTVIANLLLRS